MIDYMINYMNNYGHIIYCARGVKYYSDHIYLAMKLATPRLNVLFDKTILS